MIAPSPITLWSSNTYYDAGFQVIHAKVMYMAIDRVDPFGLSPNESMKWRRLRDALATDYYDPNSTLPFWRSMVGYKQGQVVQRHGRMYACRTSHVSSSSLENMSEYWEDLDLVPSMGRPWAVHPIFEAGQMVSCSGIRYMANHRNGGIQPVGNPDIWRQVGEDWKLGQYYQDQQIIYFGCNTYKCLSSHLSNEETTPPNMPSLWRPILTSDHVYADTSMLR